MDKIGNSMSIQERLRRLVIDIIGCVGYPSKCKKECPEPEKCKQRIDKYLSAILACLGEEIEDLDYFPVEHETYIKLTDIKKLLEEK